MPVVVIEGIDGAGKSSLAEKLVWRLGRLGKEVRLFREPGGTPEAHEIRQVIGQVKNPTARFFLFLAARAELCAKIRILQEQNPKLWIILDRFTPSTFAYQSFVGPEYIKLMDQTARQGVSPDLVLWLDLPVDQALARLQERDSDLPVFENPEVLERAASIYRRLYDVDQLSTQVWRHLDATRPLDELLEQAINRMVVLFATGKLSPHV